MIGIAWETFGIEHLYVGILLCAILGILFPWPSSWRSSVSLPGPALWPTGTRNDVAFVAARHESVKSVQH